MKRKTPNQVQLALNHISKRMADEALGDLHFVQLCAMSTALQWQLGKGDASNALDRLLSGEPVTAFPVTPKIIADIRKRFKEAIKKAGPDKSVL